MLYLSKRYTTNQSNTKIISFKKIHYKPKMTQNKNNKIIDKKQEKNQKKSKPELLAPVGNFTNLKVAIDAGADAVYFGLKMYSLRASTSESKNFSLEDLEKVKEQCKNAGVKRYLTLNSIIYDRELENIEKIIKQVSEKNLADAIICWDLAVVNLCRKYHLPIHISTQGSVSNSEAVKFYQSLGAERIVLARELDLKQIKDIVDKTGLEAEIFIHGAMCVAVSGRCFMSQFLFNKSANRGMCIHPCRRSYTIRDSQEGYELEIDNDKVLSAKDLCTLPFIDKLIQAGLKSFKIEGRNRDPRYVDKVVRVYRKAIDIVWKKISEGKKAELPEKEKNELIQELEKVYNKGFSRGFYFGTPTADDFSKVEHSQAKEMKHYTGKIVHYYREPKVAEIELVSNLEVGNTLAIIGKTTGIEEFKLESMEIENKKIQKAEKGQTVGIKVPSRVRKNDEVYVIKKRD